MSLAVFLAAALALFRSSVSTGSAEAAHVDRAASNQSALTCSQLQDRFGSSLIVLPSAADYDDLREDNWSQTAWRRPSCIATPTVVGEIAEFVGVLVANHVPFAIRSGGHSPNPSDSNIDSGVLISMSKFDKVSYDAKTRLVSIGPGARWDAVYTELDKYNRSMVGGRVMDVGVGGLSLGSGLSYLTDLYGMACDNIVSYQVRSIFSGRKIVHT